MAMGIIRNIRVVIILGMSLFFIGCATGNCRGRDMKNVKVFVSKPDGTLQCSKSPGISLEKMAGELAGIEIFSKENKNDGQMHMTLCKSPTGKVNVYEIKKSDLDRALNLGYLEYK